MFLSDVTSGLVIGLPVMITLGPISLLLLNQGIDRGVREAIPGALGVATADMTFSGLAAATGAALVAVLNPIAPALRVVGVMVLIWMAWTMARDSRREVAELKRTPVGEVDRGPYFPDPDQTLDPRRSTVKGSEELASVATATEAAVDTATTVQGPLAHLTGTRLAAVFYGLTLMNPMTIVLMSAVVIAGGRGIGTVGWAVGMTLSSLTAHGGYVLAGALLRRTCSQLTLARMGSVSAIVLVGLSVHLGLT